MLAYEPPNRVVISWDISPQWQIETDPERTSEVEVRFVAEAPERTGSRWSTATSTGTARAGRDPRLRRLRRRLAGLPAEVRERLAA